MLTIRATFERALDLMVLDDENPVADRQQFIDVTRCHDHRDAGLRGFQNDLVDGAPRRNVDAAGRLRHDEQVQAIDQQIARDDEFLLVATTKIGRLVVHPERMQSDALQYIMGGHVFAARVDQAPADIR